MRSVLLAFITFSISASAYIPDYKMIMSRVAENHGRGIYRITQDVVFPADPEPLVIEETWTVEGEDSLRVSLAGKGALKGLVSGTIVYSGGRKTYSFNGLKSAGLSADFVEPIFYFRFSKNMKPRLVSMGIAPAESLRDRPAHVGDDIKTFPEQKFLRLARTGGAVAYAVGMPSAADPSDESPGLWIEQDRFHVLKVRTKAGATINASDTHEFPNQFWLAKSKQYSWAQYSAQVLVNDVKSLPKDAKTQNLLSSKSLGDNDKAHALSLPNVDSVKDFYVRFR